MYKKVVVVSSFSIFLLISSALAAPPIGGYQPGATLNPSCVPGTSDCRVVPLATAGANTNISSLSGLTTPLSFSQGGLGISSLGAGELLYAATANSLSPLALNADFLINAGTLSVNDTNLSLAANQLTDFNSSVDSRITLQKAAINGLATLDADGKIPTSQLSSLELNNVFVVANSSTFPTTGIAIGDIAIATEENKTYVLKSVSPDEWVELLSTASVLSVNGKIGAVSLTTSDINEGSNLYFTDERVDDRVGALIQDGVGIYKTYDDAGNTLSLNINESLLNVNNLGGFPLSASKGGTGLSSINVGEMIYGSGTNLISILSPGASGQVLKMNGGLPVWETDNNTLFYAGSGLSLSSSTFSVDPSVLNLDNFAGILSVSKGGTGASSTSTAFNNLAPIQTGQSGKFLTTNGTTVSWAAVPGGITDHTLLTNIGTNTHAQLDAHLVNFNNPHSVSASQLGAGNIISELNTGTSTINWIRIDKASSSLSELATRNYTDLTGRPADDDFHTLSAETGINAGDEVLIYSQANSNYRKMTRANFVAGLGAGGSTAWSDLTTPIANLSLSLNGYTTSFNFGNSTGANNLFSIADTINNSGTGYLFQSISASGSKAKPFAFGVNGDILASMNASGTTMFGDAVNNLKISSNGALRLSGSAITWDDLRVPLEAAKSGGANDPTFVQLSNDGAGSRGVYAYSFPANTASRELFFSVQLPHSWRVGSVIDPHVHWAPSDATAGNVYWGLECTWTDIGNTIGSTTIGYATSSALGAKRHTLADFPNYDGTGMHISSMLSCRVFRNSNDALDTYNGAAYLLEIDFHYQVDSLGSDSEMSKSY